MIPPPLCYTEGCWALRWWEIPCIISLPDYTDTESFKARLIPHSSAY